MNEYSTKEYKDFYGEFNAWQVKEKTWVISYMQGHNYVFLLEGEEKALLIDTAMGANNLRKYVETLTSKPVVVVNTHCHIDHIGGNGEWEEVFMSEGVKIDEVACGWMAAMLPVPIDYSKFPHADYKKSYLHTGDIIDLGGREIEVIEAKPAHSCSGLYFLDKTNRLFFPGDDLEPGESGRIQMGMYAMAPAGTTDGVPPLKERLENMRANSQLMKERSDEFDLVLPCHNGCPMAKSYIDDFIGLINGIFEKEIKPSGLNGSQMDEIDEAQMMTCLQYKGASIYVATAEYKAMLEQI